MIEQVDKILDNREKDFPNELLRARDILLELLDEKKAE